MQEDWTAPVYRLWSIGDQYPGMVRVAKDGVSIALEIWQVPLAGLVQVLLQEPPGLASGQVYLQNGGTILGALAEAITCEGQKEITAWGGWRAYRENS